MNSRDAREASGGIPRSRPEPALGQSSPPGRLKNAGRYSISCSWGLLDHSLNLQTPQEALRSPPRRSCGAPEHLMELSSTLQGANFELPNTSRSSPAASKDRIPSSRTLPGALQQPPRTEFRDPEHLEELSSSLHGTKLELPSKQASKPGGKQAKPRKASKQATE